MRCDPSKLLLDPVREVDRWRDRLGAGVLQLRLRRPTKRNTEDSAPHTMKSVVVNPWFDWQEDRAPRIPYHESVIYEAHVKGISKTHPDIPRRSAGRTRRWPTR
jgi:glycogen operon protein